MEIEFSPDKIFLGLTERGHAWADKEAAAELLEETKKTVLAELTIKYSAPVGEKVASEVGVASGIRTPSRIEAEQKALASPEYREHIVAMNSARRAANRARVDYDCGKTLAELKRSQESTKRAEMNLR